MLGFINVIKVLENENYKHINKMLKKQAHTSKVFNDFKTIDHRDAKAIVRFYHQNKENIHELRFYEAFVLQLHYTFALHYLGEYEKHIDEADNIIYLSIDNNIQIYKGEDIYQKTLFQKAQSYYFLGAFDKAQHIYLELIKIEPKNKKYAKALKQIFLKTEVTYIEDTLLCGIFVLLFSIGFTTLYLLFSNLLGNYHQVLLNVIASSFLFGIVSFLTGLVLQKTILEKKISVIREKALERKALKDA